MTRRVWVALLRDERGSTLPLIVGAMVLGLVLVFAVSGATALYLERERLYTIADGAALAGAEAFELGAVSAADGRIRAELRGDDVRAAAAGYLADVEASSLEDLRLEAADAPDGRSARVWLSAWWRPPMLTVLLPDGIRVDAEATARSVFD